MPRLPALTLVSALLLTLSLTNTAAANVGPIHLSHRGADHARMVKRYTLNDVQKRQLLDPILDPSGNNGPSTTSTPPPSTPGGGIIGGIGSGLGGGSTSTTTSSSTEVETSTTTTSSSTRREPSITPTPSASSSSTIRPVTITQVQPGDDSADPVEQKAIEQNRQHQSTLSRIPDNVRIILIVIASILAGLLIVWTAIRKWKLRSSRSFQNRLAPIDWQPDSDKDRVSAPPAMTEVGSDKDSIRRNMFAPDGPSTLAPPAHDFTAGAYSRSASPLPNPYARTPSPAPFRTASPAPYRTASPAPANGLQRYPSSGSGHGGYDPRRGY